MRKTLHKISSPKINILSSLERKKPKLYFIKRKLFLTSINAIGNEYLNKKIIRHDDFFCFFMLTRYAKNLKNIKKPFYLVLKRENKNNTLINFHKTEKNKIHKENRCISFLYYIEFLLFKTNNTFFDKQIAEYELENYYLNNSCRFSNISKIKGIQTCQLFLNNKYINNTLKKKIRLFLKDINKV